MQTETTTTPVGTKALASGDASVVPVGVEAQRDSGQSSSFGRQRDPQSGSGGSRDVVPDAALASATSSSAMRAQTDSLGSVDSARPAGLSVDSVASLRDEILSKVVEFRNQTPTSMTVILRPDPGTEMSISLRSTDGRIDVHVRLERGDASTLHESWSGLQQSLSQHGVNLMGLETAPLPSLPKAAEHRVDATASATGVAPGGVDARLAAASAMSFNTGDPQQRDSSPRSGGQDGQQQGGSGLFDGRQGGAGQQGLFQSRQDEPGGLPAFRNSPGLPSRGGSSAASGVPAGAGLAESAEPGAPWESWA
jgi:hypothetical protein